MEKYIIELPENTHWIQWIMEGTKDHHPYMDFKQVEDLTPYTAPDIGQVRKEGYEKGYETGYEDGYNEPGKNQQEAYQRGLSDAWEAARKVVALSIVDRRKVFGSEYMYSILEKHTASEAIEKLKAYEQEEQIQVGDEVITASGKAVVTGVGPVHFEYVYADGSNGYDEVKNVKKTGRHFPEIAKVLQKMKES